MLEFPQLKKLDDYRYLVPRDTRSGMLTDALIYTNERLLQDLLKDLSVEQAINVAMLPGIVGRSLAMPDIHQGYGFPIGGVAATDPHHDGVVSPGGVGFDINCGVRLLATDLRHAQLWGDQMGDFFRMEPQPDMPDGLRLAFHRTHQLPTLAR